MIITNPDLALGDNYRYMTISVDGSHKQISLFSLKSSSAVTCKVPSTALFGKGCSCRVNKPLPEPCLLGCCESEEAEWVRAMDMYLDS